MKKGKGASPAELRDAAEDRLKARAIDRGARLPEDERRLLHELEVHQIELELQNEELQVARLETEAALERYTLLFDFAPLGYAILAPDGTISEINHVGTSLLGRVRSQLIGLSFESFLSSGDRAAFKLLLRTVLERDSKETCDVALTKRGEIPLAAQLTMRALTRQERMVLVAFEDITERQHQEQMRARTEETLREVDRRKNEFLAVLSHELRNPLGPIQNSLFLLAKDEPNSEKARQARAIIDRQVRLLTRLVDDLLDVTRITRGKIQLRRDLVEVAELVRHAMEDHRMSFEARGLRLEARCEGAPFWVDADPARLVQALSNLLGNAEKFTPRGGRVVVSVNRDHDEVVLRVRDTGAGIDPETLEHVFEPFVQAPQTIDRAHGGLGLGLAMVKGLVELQGGSVRVFSGGAGRGTEVTVRLPIVDAPAQASAPTASKTGRRHRRVLVIDDNVDNGDSLQFALESTGHEVRLVLDGPTGLELARQFRPEVVVSDIGLPDMDGYAIARAFRSDPSLKDVYLIALSGYTRPEDLERAADAGFDQYVGKPVQLDDLDHLISDLPARTRGLLAMVSVPSSPLH